MHRPLGRNTGGKAGGSSLSAPARIRDRVSAVTSGCEHNKEKVRLFVEAVLNEGRLELIDELVAHDYVGHLPDTEDGVFGPQGLRGLVASRRSACPNLHVRILDLLAEEDRVATRWQATSGTTAPGDVVRSCAGMSIVRLLAGKQVDSHTEYTAPT